MDEAERLSKSDSTDGAFVANTISEFQCCLDKIRETISTPDYSFKGHTFVYRGHSDCDYDLLPSIFRNDKISIELMNEVGRGKRNIRYDMYKYECEIISEMMCQYPDAFGFVEDDIDALTVLQHWGIPTRLLDVTANALVALYFAVQEANGKDGKVFLFDIKLKELNASYRPKAKFISKLEMYHVPIVPQGYEKNIPKCPIFITPKFLTERQHRQQGYFYYFPNEYDNDAHRFRSCPVKFDGKLFEIKIPVAAKDKILTDLNLFYGMTRHYLFPESPQDYASEIIRRFQNGLLQNPEHLRETCSQLAGKCLRQERHDSRIRNLLGQDFS